MVGEERDVLSRAGDECTTSFYGRDLGLWLLPQLVTLPGELLTPGFDGLMEVRVYGTYKWIRKLKTQVLRL